MPKITVPVAATAALLLTLFVGFVPASAQSSESWRAMNQPVEPFHIMDNLYYVGANSVAAYLITTPKGHILIDGGFVETVPMIKSGIEKLGFELADVKILLNSHAHIDHCAGLAQLKKETGAQFFASEADAPLLERGGLGDDLFGDSLAFPAVQVDRRLKDGEQVNLGGTTLTARITGGHTRGCTSWVFDLGSSDLEDGDAQGGKTSHRAVSICSLSALDGMQFLENPTYPGIKEDFERSFATLKDIEADIFLASHADFAKLVEKSKRKKQGHGKDGEPSPFIDPEGYRKYIERAQEKFERMVATERTKLSADES